MSVKIFLPSELFYSKADCDIYGEIHISENNSVSYFVIASGELNNKSCVACNEIRHLGSIERSGPKKKHSSNRDVSLNFCYNLETANIYVDKLSIKPAKVTGVNVFLYDTKKVLQLQCEPIQVAKQRNDNFDDTQEQYDDITMLFNLLTHCEALRYNKRSISECIFSIIYFPLKSINDLFLILIECKTIVFLIKRTVFYDHYLYWKMCRDAGKRNYNIVLDKLLGITMMIILLFYIPRPGDYLIQATHSVISNVRLLLFGLKGSPIGLKLNVHLNNFLLDCFGYHIDLWATFLNLIEPAVRQLFVPIALLGFMGFSFQLALLSDLISVMGLHAYCFYIYTAVLYKVEIKGLQVLWKVVLGKRRNVLNNRVESHNYMNRQLYLATIFFTSLLFLFPTILVYYAVFTTLRLCIILIKLILRVKRKHILEFPLQIFMKWISGRFFEIESLELEHIEHEMPLSKPEPNENRMCLFVIHVKSSTLDRVFSSESGILKKCLPIKEEISFSSIVQRILQGKL